MSNHLQLLLLYAPAIIFGLLFLWDLHKNHVSSAMPSGSCSCC